MEVLTLSKDLKKTFATILKLIFSLQLWLFMRLIKSLENLSKYCQDFQALPRIKRNEANNNRQLRGHIDIWLNMRLRWARTTDGTDTTSIDPRRVNDFRQASALGANGVDDVGTVR